MLPVQSVAGQSVQRKLDSAMFSCDFCDITLKTDLDVTKHLASDTHTRNVDTFISLQPQDKVVQRNIPRKLTEVFSVLKLRSPRDVRDLADKNYFHIPRDNPELLGVADEIIWALIRTITIFLTKDVPEPLRTQIRNAPLENEKPRPAPQPEKQLPQAQAQAQASPQAQPSSRPKPRAQPQPQQPQSQSGPQVRPKVVPRPTGPKSPQPQVRPQIRPQQQQPRPAQPQTLHNRPQQPPRPPQPRPHESQPQTQPQPHSSQQQQQQQAQKQHLQPQPQQEQQVKKMKTAEVRTPVAVRPALVAETPPQPRPDSTYRPRLATIKIEPKDK